MTDRGHRFGADGGSPGDRALLLEAVLDALPIHVALLDAQGVIVAVNEVWRRFGVVGGFSGDFGVGENYLAVCDRAAAAGVAEARQAAEGIRGVLGGSTPEFALEYPCQAPGAAPRWFRLVVTPSGGVASGGAVVAHADITERKLAEIDRQRLLHDLGERIKELRLLYDVARLLRDDRLPVHEVLRRVATALPAAMQYAEIAAARVAFGDADAATPGFAPTPWRLAASSEAGDGTAVEVEVVYREPMPEADEGPFLAEERRLLDSLADLLLAYFERRRDREVLAASEARLRAVIESEPECVKVISPDGRVLEMNPAGLRMVDAEDRAEVVGRPVIDLVHPADRDRFLALHQHAGEGHTVEGQFRFVSLKGTERWMESHATPLRSPDGTVEAVLSITRDITERRAAEERLRASEERFRVLARVTNDAIWDWDLRTDALWWNEGFETLFDFRRDEVEPTIEAWYSRLHPEDRERVVAHIHRAIAGEGSGWSDQYRVLRKDGSHAWVLDRGHVLRDAAGRPVRMVGGMTDLTERKRLTERLAEQAALLDAAYEAIYVLDLDDRIVYWNRGAARTYGWAAEEALGRRSTDLLHLEPAHLEQARQALPSRGEWQGEMRQRTTDGREITVEVRLTLVRDAEGRPKSILAINSDVTEKKKIEAQLLRAQRLESVGTLAGGIAHDLNNVLTPVLMAVALLQEKVVDPDARGLLDTLEQSAQRGADLIRQMLSFTRGMEGQRVPVQLVHLVRDLEKIVADTFPKNIRFAVCREGDVWPVVGDPTQLYQVMMNLCVNARDAMPEGGALTVSLGNVTLDEVYAGMNPDSRPGPYVTLEVEDTGHGIPLEHQDRIFDPFFTTKEIGRGTGLGLSTVLAIVKSHGGFVHVYSEPGHGARFKVYLPAETTAEAAERAAVDRSGLPRGHGELILVVDDDDAVREVCCKTLERYGYRVLVASNGAEAVSTYAARRGEIALVLTDMAMPIMDGAATIVALRAIDPHVRVVASSGHPANGGVSKALGAGVQHFVPKPYTAATLLRAIREALDRG